MTERDKLLREQKRALDRLNFTRADEIERQLMLSEGVDCLECSYLLGQLYKACEKHGEAIQ